MVDLAYLSLPLSLVCAVDAVQMVLHPRCDSRYDLASHAPVEYPFRKSCEDTPLLRLIDRVQGYARAVAIAAAYPSPETNHITPRELSDARLDEIALARPEPPTGMAEAAFPTPGTTEAAEHAPVMSRLRYPQFTASGKLIGDEEEVSKVTVGTPTHDVVVATATRLKRLEAGGGL